MFYKKNSSADISKDLFKNPTSEYRATPFWAWNCELNTELLNKEIDCMKEMGFGGFHMHPRVGMSTTYLSDDFMNLIKNCIQKAKDEDMLAYLYDEDKWPSGFAGGYNTKSIENRQKYICFTQIPYKDSSLTLKEDIEIANDNLPKSKYRLLTCYDVELDDDGYLLSYKKIKPSDSAQNTKWFLYLEYMSADPWYNGQAYCDTLKKDVIENFAKITHERYKECVGEDFGKTVPSIFTDEPQFKLKRFFTSPYDKKGCVLPFTTDLDKTFKAAYGYSLISRLPEVFFELPNGEMSYVRYHYHDHVSERFASAFSDTLGAWCEKNNIALTGHMMQEPTLYSQTNSIGDCMRSYRGFQIPGIDMLGDKRELTTAKQCQSAVHQYGREAMLSELYGVTNWEFDFKGHKLQGDWQAALGVTVRVPHLFWASMRGEAKRDYPASIGYQSPWYKEYKYVEDHFARVNTLMTRGVPDVKIAVVHPIESYWMLSGPFSQTCDKRNDATEKFESLIDWMLFATLDFDYLCESLIDKQFGGVEGGLNIGKMKYDAVVVPDLLTIRSSTLSALEAFNEAGGKVIFMGKIPTYVDAKKSTKALKFAKKCKCISWSYDKLIENLEDEREIEILTNEGRRSSNLIYQSRIDGDCKNIFISHVKHSNLPDVESISRYSITIKGIWKVEEYDTLTGDINVVKAKYKNGKTTIDWNCFTYDSLLLRLSKGESTEGKILSYPDFSTMDYLDHSASYTLEEKNVLVLDCPKYSINGGEVAGPEEILKIDNKVRDELNISHRNDHMVQPWVACASKNPKDRVILYYEFDSDIEYVGAELALESVQYASVKLNGKKANMTVTGYYVDEDSIKKISLPKIKKGTNVLEVNYKFGDITQLESMFILGDFGVSCLGVYNKITTLPERLYFADTSLQGLPYYGGNITYHMNCTISGDSYLDVNKFRGSAITVDVDDKRVGIIAYSPHSISLIGIEPGTHKLDLTLLGNRCNTFGQLHNTDEKLEWAGPGSFRTTGRRFSYEKVLKRNGILSTPVIKKI